MAKWLGANRGAGVLVVAEGRKGPHLGRNEKSHGLGIEVLVKSQMEAVAVLGTRERHKRHPLARFLLHVPFAQPF